MKAEHCWLCWLDYNLMEAICSNCLRAKTFCKSKLVQLFSEVGHGGCGWWFVDLLELCYSVSLN